MTYNIGKTPENLKPVSDRNNPALGVFKGIVVDADDDIQKMGRLRVWIPEFGGFPNDPKYCFVVSYASPFAGATPVRDNDAASSGTTQQSYGMWFVPPDVGNEVLVCFVNGDTARGYWFACVYQQNMNHMVPGVAADASTEGDYEPVMEYNKQDPTITNYANPPRHRFAPLADGLKLQGLETDEARGPATTSARRSGISKAYGFVTPRGNTMHIDDSEDNEFIRLRTRSGVGITIHETEGFVFIVSKNGKSYVEVSDAGVNFYTEQPMNMRTTNDYNIQSSRDINIDAGRNVNIYATNHIAMAAGQQTYISAGSDLIMGSAGNTTIKANNNVLVTAADLIGILAKGNLQLQGNPIMQGVAPPSATDPLPPERHPMPDGSGGVAPGSSIGSGMTHRLPYDARNARGSAGAGGNEPVTAGPRPTTAQIKKLMKLMYRKLRSMGWTDVGARTMIAQIGRENDYNPNVFFASSFNDPRKGSDAGLISWQGPRKTALFAFLRTHNALNPDGTMKREDNTVLAQLEFLDAEMQSHKQYRPSYIAVRDASLDYRKVEYTLSTNYVAWARGGSSDNRFTKSQSDTALAKMDAYFNTTGSV